MKYQNYFSVLIKRNEAFERIHMNNFFNIMKIIFLLVVLLPFNCLAFNLFSDDLEVSYFHYSRVNYKDCKSPLQVKPSGEIVINVIGKSKDIFLKYRNLEDNTAGLEKLKSCNSLNKKNWSCGGDVDEYGVDPRYSMIDGVFSYMGRQSDRFPRCAMAERVVLKN